jgi:hypothetical protein
MVTGGTVSEGVDTVGSVTPPDDADGDASAPAAFGVSQVTATVPALVFARSGSTT